MICCAFGARVAQEWGLWNTAQTDRQQRRGPDVRQSLVISACDPALTFTQHHSPATMSSHWHHSASIRFAQQPKQQNITITKPASRTQSEQSPRLDEDGWSSLHWKKASSRELLLLELSWPAGLLSLIIQSKSICAAIHYCSLLIWLPARQAVLETTG